MAKHKRVVVTYICRNSFHCVVIRNLRQHEGVGGGVEKRRRRIRRRRNRRNRRGRRTRREKGRREILYIVKPKKIIILFRKWLYMEHKTLSNYCSISYI